MKTYVEVGGILDADGTLRLDERPDLPAGPVRVTLKVAPAKPPAGLGWWEVLQWIRAEQAARGYVPRSAEEIDADLAEVDREDEEGDRRRDELNGLVWPPDAGQ